MVLFWAQIKRDNYWKLNSYLAFFCFYVHITWKSSARKSALCISKPYHILVDRQQIYISCQDDCVLGRVEEFQHGNVWLIIVGGLEISWAIGFGRDAGVLAEEGSEKWLVCEVQSFTDLLNCQVVVCKESLCLQYYLSAYPFVWSFAG